MKTPYKKISLLFYIFFVFLMFPGFTSAQSLQERKADQYYERYAYSKATVLYESLFREDKGNPKYIQRLGYSYYKMLNYRKALIYYSQLVQLKEHQVSDLYDYSQLLKIDGRPELAKVWLEQYVEQSPGDLKAKKQLEGMDLYNMDPVKNISVKNMAGNTSVSDMCVNYYNDHIIYSSARDSVAVIKNVYDWNNQPYLDLYLSHSGTETGEKDTKSLFRELNSKFHEGPVSFSSDYNTIYFTRNNYLNGHVTTTKDGVNNLKIFIADFDGKKWQNIRNLPFNSNRYSVGHPALSPDNKTLYFISDMPGGYGQTDIYRSELINGEWGTPVNLGATVNTSGKEMFPYVDKEGILYFSSNGRPGKGGLDIFAAKEENPDAYKVNWVASPVNSAYDDFGCVLNTDSVTGYFTSDRPGGKGSDDNYSFQINFMDLQVSVYDDYTKGLLPGSKIKLKSEDGNVLDEKNADENGMATFQVKPGQKYQLLAENKNYLPETRELQIKGSLYDLVQREDMYLKTGALNLMVEIVDKESGLIIPEAKVVVSKGQYDQSQFEDKNGIVRMRMNKSTDYTFLASAVEYFENTGNFSSIGKNAGDYTLTIELEKMSAGKQFVLDDLYYDLDKYNIRRDAAIVLDRLVKILKDNPEIRIEVGSHTDSRAIAEYNQKLSQRRSESVMSYLISKGIEKRRLVAKGYGESQLINKCADGVDCPEAEHQANRRTVIEILNPDIRKIKRGGKDVYYF